MMSNQTATQLTNIDTNFFTSLLLNPSAIVSVVAMFITVILFIINICVIRRNAKIEFERKINLNYYEITVINAMKELFRIVSLIKMEYYQLMDNYNPLSDESTLRKNCEIHLNKIDEYIECMGHGSTVLIQVYSESSSKDLQNVIETFDDSCVDIISKYSSPELKTRRIDTHTKAFNTAISKTISDIYKICKQLYP